MGMHGVGLDVWRGAQQLTLAALLVALVALALAVQPPVVSEQGSSGATSGAPLLFMPNAGQADSSVRFTAGGSGHAFHFTSQKVVLDFQRGERGVALGLRFRGANLSPAIAAERRVAGGAAFEQLRYRELWPGIDMVFRGTSAQLKYEFLVRPGARPSDIRLAYAGAESLSRAANGSLAIATPLGTLRDAAPKSMQRGKQVETSYQVSGSSYGFTLGAYDRSQPLVIDPALTWSTLIGGSDSDAIYDMAVGGDGSIYVSSRTASADFPTTPGAYSASGPSFVAKFAPGGALVYSTKFPGAVFGIAVDSAGSAYLHGGTGFGFPTTPGAYDTVQPDPEFDETKNFVSKLDPTGSTLEYSTFLGRGDGTTGAIAVDAQGDAYVTGATFSQSYPTTPGAVDSVADGSREVYVSKLNATGTGLVYSTYLGGVGNEAPGNIKVDPTGNAYITGQTGQLDHSQEKYPTTPGAWDTTLAGIDAFVTKLNPTGTALVYSTYLGGSSNDGAAGLALDASQNVVVGGATSSSNFPTTPGAYSTTPQDGGFLTKLNPAGSGLVYSTFLSAPTASRVVTDGTGSAYIAGSAASPIAGITADALDPTFNDREAFLQKYNPSGSALLYGSYLGGSGADYGHAIGLGALDQVYVAGSTESPDFPTTPGAYDTSFNGGIADGFLTKIGTAPFTGYPRPAGASPLHVSLVTAYDECTAFNRTHGPPLAFASCNPPARSSAHLTVGTADSNGKVVRYESYLRLRTIVGNPGNPADEADVGIDFFSNGVLTNALDNYTGELRAKVPLRITDRDNTPNPGAATTQDFTFDIDATCAVVPDPTPHSVCQTTTTADALIPGAIKEGRRAIWQVGQVLVYDGGPDGDTSTVTGNTVFARQGLFIP
jgi:hypothetical protein